MPEPTRVKPSAKTTADQVGINKKTASPEPEKIVKRHIIRPGQTYYRLSQLYGVTLNQLYTWNNLSERIPLAIGQTVIVGMTPNRPRLRSTDPTRNNSNGPTITGKENSKVLSVPSERVIYHIVRAGQTVYRVALINKVSVSDLMRWNNLANYTIEVGQKLLIRKQK